MDLQLELINRVFPRLTVGRPVKFCPKTVKLGILFIYFK